MMKKLLIILLLGIGLVSKAQYNPSIHVTVNDALGVAQAVPTDSRSQFYNISTFTYRNYANRAEVLSYLNLAKYRSGRFPIYMDTAGHTGIFWFQDCTQDTCLKFIQTVAGSTDSSIFATNYRVDTAKLNLRAAIAGKLQNTLAAGKIWAGDLSGNAAQVTPGGDISMTSGGSITVNNNAITFPKLQTLPSHSVFGRPDLTNGNSRATYLGYGTLFDADTVKVDTTTLKPIFGGGTFIPPGNDQDILFNDGGAVGADDNLTFSKTFRAACIGCNTSTSDASLSGAGFTRGNFFISSQAGPIWITGDTATLRATAGAANIVRLITNNSERLKIDNNGILSLPSQPVTTNDTVANKVLVFNPVSKATAYMNWPSTGGGGAQAISGDASGTLSGTDIPITLNAVNSSPGTYINPVVTVNGKGLSTNISNACLWPSENNITWPIYRRAKWHSLYDFTNYGGISLSLNGNNIDITGGSSNYSVYATIPSFGGMTCMGRWTDTMRYKIISSGTGNAIGINSQNNSNTAHDIVAFFQNGGSSSFVYVSNPSSNTVLATSGSSVSYSIGDSIELTGTFDQYSTTFVASAKNITTGSARVSVTYTYPSPASAVYPNTGNMAIYHMGGTQRIYYLSFNGSDTRNPLLELGVDSKGQGYYATTYSSGFVSQLRGNSTYSTTIAHGGEGDRTDMILASWGEIMRQNPKYFLMAGMGRNDLGTGVSLSQVEKNYDTIYQRCISGGITPLFMMFPEGSTSGQSTNLKSLDTYLRTNYSSIYINAWDTLSSNGNTIIPAYSNSDSIHLSQAGNDAVYRAIIASPLIQSCNNRTFQLYQNDPYITTSGNSNSLTVPLVQDATRKNDSTFTLNFTGGGAKDITLRFGSSATTWENVLDNGSAFTHDHTISGAGNQFIWNNTLLEIGGTSFFIPTADAASDVGFPTNRFNHLYGHQTLSNLSVFGNLTNWFAQQGNDAVLPISIVPTDTDTSKNAVVLMKPDATSVGGFGIKQDGRVYVKADSVGVPTGGCAFRDALTGLLKIGPCGGGSGSDTLKVANVGTPGARLGYTGADTLYLKSISNSTTLSDSSIQVNTLEKADQTLSSNRTITAGGNGLIIAGTSTTLRLKNTNVNTVNYGFTASGTAPFYGGIGWINGSGSYNRGVALSIDTFNNVYSTSTSTNYPGYSNGSTLFAGGNFATAGGVYAKYLIVNSNTTIDGTVNIVYIDATSGSITVTLPSVSAVSNTGSTTGIGITYIIKRVDASGNTVTVSAGGGDTIDGSANFTLTSNQSKTIQATTSNKWYIQ